MKTERAGDMTVGTPWKLLTAFALPMVAGNLFQQVYSMVDSIVVGRYVGKNALAAIGATQSVLFLMICLIIGLTMGTCIITAQHFGAGNDEKVRSCALSAVYISIGAWVLIAVLGLLCSGPVLSLLHTPAEIMPEAKRYLIISTCGSIGPIAYNMAANLMRSLGDSKSSLYALLVSSVLNVVLDLLFVIQFGMGVDGVAYATVIAQLVSYGVCLLCIKYKHKILILSGVDKRPDLKMVKAIIRVGIPMSLQNCFTSFGMMAVQSIINGFGTDTIAGFTAANKIDQIAIMPINSVGMAFSTYVGQNYGAGNMQRIRAGVRAGCMVVVSFSFVLMAFILLAGPHMVALFGFAKETEVSRIACEYLNLVAIFYWLNGILYIFLNLFRGMGRMLLSTVAGCLEPACKIIVSILLGSMLGRLGIWMSWPIGWAVALTIPFFVYCKGKWQVKTNDE